MQGRKPMLTSRYFATYNKRSSSPSTSTPWKRAKTSTGNPVSLSTRQVVAAEIPVVSTSKQRAKSLAKTTPSTGTRLVMDTVEIPISTIPPIKPIQQGRGNPKLKGKLVTSHYWPPQADATPADPQPIVPAPPNKRKKQIQLLVEETKPTLPVVTSHYFPVASEPVTVSSAPVTVTPMTVTVKKKTHSLRVPLTLAAEMTLPAIEAPELWWEADTIAVTRKRTIARFKSNPVLYYNIWNAKPTLVQGMFKYHDSAILHDLRS